MSDAPAKALPRRHDLDMLRAFAMILGIALHGALSFTGFPWAVQDTHPNGAFGLLFAAIHGFRMPLFILVSGYFTMMLWRKRGMAALLRQRTIRVLIPCVLGVFTVVPAVDWAGGWAYRRAATQDAQASASKADDFGLVASIRKGDAAGVEKALAAGANPNERDPEFGVPPLGWAALLGDARAAATLLDKGADANGTDRSGYRPLHSAAFFGHPEVASLLLQHGADPTAKGQRDDTAVELTRADPGATSAIAASLRLPPRDLDALATGRAECRPLLGAEKDEPPTATASGAGWERVRRSYAAFLTSDRWLVSIPGAGSIHLITTPIFHHLWFLWSLVWLVAIFAVVAPLLDRLAAGRSLAGWVLSPWRLLWVVPLTMLPQSLMGTLTPAFGPDTSTGLIPQPHLLLYYALFFGFGALYYDADDTEGRLGRRWRLTLALSLFLTFPLALATMSQPWVGGLIQAAYAWGMTFALIGLFRRYASRENATVRYLSDSAYWLYLAHLPIVILLQAWVRDWNQPAALKFALVCALTTAASLLSYQLLVRHTPLGRLLNGPGPRGAKLAPALQAAEA